MSITVTSISKKYTIGSHEPKSVLQQLLSVGAISTQKRTLNVLSDISFELRAGEILGIVGNNGCGKSTLIKIVAGILQPDSGSVAVEGRLVPLIHLDTGVKARLTMKENIYLAGTLLGMTQKEISQKFDNIVSYSGLDSFVHTKWYQLSDGMKQKVVFAIGIHSNPDVLLLDEAFSAGDEAFRIKSIQTISAMAARGVCILMVGHNLGSMASCCDRTLWIDGGVVKLQGKSEEVVAAYKNL
jgi:ABC-type polysaccharide/polyol phosphate transport system ATPase subunit